MCVEVQLHICHGLGMASSRDTPVSYLELRQLSLHCSCSSMLLGEAANQLSGDLSAELGITKRGEKKASCNRALQPGMRATLEQPMQGLLSSPAAWEDKQHPQGICRSRF